MIRLSAGLLFFLVTQVLYSQWDPNAGLISPYSSNARIIAEGNNPEAVIDGNFETKWESSNPLPENYIKDEGQNVFLRLAEKINSNLDEGRKAIDGDLASHVTVSSGTARFSFPQSVDLSLVSLKANSTQDIRLILKNNRGTVLQEFLYKSAEAYKVKKFRVASDKVSTLELESGGDFSLFEIAAMAGPPVTDIIIDLGRKRPVEWIDTRHFGGKSVEAISMSVSAEKQHWKEVAELYPEALNMVTTRFGEQPIRYIKLAFQLTFNDYAKAYLWEIRAYNRYGPYGSMPVFKESTQPLKNILGVNTFWGWGMEKHASDLPSGKGPDQFSSFMRHVRYYHNLDWDVTDPDQPPDYSSMPGSLSQSWLDWDKEYKTVWNKGFSIQTTLQIPKAFSPEEWDTPVKSAYNFGKSFGRYFGPANNYLVEAVEIGNEPWKYGPLFYNKIFEGMSKGLTEAAPRLTVLPCALSANKQQPYLNNYIGNWLNAEMKEHIGALNSHLYSFTTNQKGEVKAVHPEHPESEMRGILNMLNFRDKNMPETPVHITEWGWDAPSSGTDCTHSECVSEEAQAAYGIRGMLMFYRLGIKKVFWFFFSDTDNSSFRYERSGLLTSPENGLKPKKAWYALRSIIRETGEEYLFDVIENDNAWIYYFKDASETPSHIVMWLPEEHDPQLKKEISFKTKRKVKEAFLPSENNTPVPFTREDNKSYRIEIGTYPVVVELE